MQARQLKVTTTSGAQSAAHDLRHDLAVHVGQSHVASAESHREPFVIDAEQVQHVGVHVVHGEFVFDNAVAENLRTASTCHCLRLSEYGAVDRRSFQYEFPTMISVLPKRAKS